MGDISIRHRTPANFEAAARGGTTANVTIKRRSDVSVGRGDAPPVTLAVLILTYNEEQHIARVIEAVAGIATEIFVIDSFSTDRTVELAKAHGATVLQNKFINYAKQFQWGLDNAPITASWIMRLDADEVIEADLAARIRNELPRLPDDVVG